MKMNFMYCAIIILGYKAVSCDLAKHESTYTVTLHTDLVDIIGINNSCGEHSKVNISENENLLAKQGIVISNYVFHDVNLLDSVIGKCDVIRSPRYEEYDWACFASDNLTSRDPNWLFVDCRKSTIISVKCLETEEINTVTENLCFAKDKNKKQNNSCHDFSYGKGNSAVCSHNFRVKRLAQTKVENIKATFTSLEDTIAYLCIAFILTTFVLAVLIPAEKCKPTYKYDKEQGLRVPLEIYEMYGVSYQPSAKKKRNRKSVNMDVVPAITSHLSNVAAVANNPIDWKGYKTKFKFQHNQPLFKALAMGLGENIKVNDKGLLNVINGIERTDKENIGRDNHKHKRGSADSIVSAGTFDYSLFQNQLENDSENMTSESNKETGRKSSDGRRKQMSRRGSQAERLEGVEEASENDVHHIFEWIDDAYAIIQNQSPDFTNYEQDERQKTNEGKARVRFESDSHDTDGTHDNEKNGSNEQCYEDNDDEKDITDNDNDDNRSDDTDMYEKDQTDLFPIYEDLTEGEPCTCGNRFEPIYDENSLISSSNDEELVKVKTTSVFTVPKQEKDKEANKRRYTEDVDIDAFRPRVSVTVEFPRSVGAGNEKQTLYKLEDEKQERKNRRSLSAANASNKHDPTKDARKFSLC